MFEFKSSDIDGQLPAAAYLLLFVAIAILVGVDLAADYGEGTGAAHLLAEAGAFAFACAGVVLLWRRLRSAQRAVTVLQSDLSAVRSESYRWQRENEELLRGLGEAIQRQFERWELTGAEQEVGLLLLKGLEHKEVANLRSTSERTAREQARAVYRKAGVTGRSELSAFFLEDLLVPMGDRIET